jgi:hypothetical protein
VAVKLTAKTLWSPDLDPPSEGIPPDDTRFSVFVQVTIGPPGDDGGETFGFTVASRDSLSEGFVGQTLVLDRFAWSDVRGFVERRIDIDGAHSDSWDQLISLLAPFMKYSDAE